MNIIKAHSQDEIDQAFQVRKKVFIDEQHVPPEIEMDSLDGTAIHFVGYLDNEPIAASRLRMVDDYGKLERICILKECRGQSFGKQLINVMEKEIIKHGLAEAKLNAQTHAAGFYEQLGYSITSEEFIDAGIPHVTMAKTVN